MTTERDELTCLAGIIDDPGTNLSQNENDAVRWARDQVVELRRELDDARAQRDDRAAQFFEARRERDEAWARAHDMERQRDAALDDAEHYRSRL